MSDLEQHVVRSMPAVVVLVGTSGSGKTTLRHRLIGAGLDPALVVSLDDLRRDSLAHDVGRGLSGRPLQHYSVSAVRRAARRGDVLAAVGAGYVADATHLRRRDRVVHVRTAEDTGLPAVAVLTPLLPVEELVARNERRPADEHVPVDVLRRQRHRRSLLSAQLLGEEGFSLVLSS